MALENFGFIKDLVDTNPAGSDPKSQGDDHLRGVKETLKNQFPGFTDGIGVTITEEDLNKYSSPWVGEDYTDEDAIGDNATAVIYPDGTIVGSTDNGSYVKHNTGVLEMWNGTADELDSADAYGSIFQSSTAGTWTYPIVMTAGADRNGVYSLGTATRWCIITVGTDSAIYRQFSALVQASVAAGRVYVNGRWK